MNLTIDKRHNKKKYASRFVADGLISQIKNKFAPEKIILFGSYAARRQTAGSDIDLCIVMPADDKRALTADLYYMIESDRPLDFLVYTPDEWERCVADKTSFACMILTEGVVLHG